MKTIHIAALATMALAMAACNQADNTQTADQIADTNQVSINRVRADAPNASVDVRVDTGEIKENINDAAGATRDALVRAGEKIRVETKDFADRVSKSLEADPKTANASRNVTINSSNGKVTLQGTVATDAEKQEIERKIRQMTDATQVDNQIRVSAQVK